MIYSCISEQDPEIYNLILKEQERQSRSLELIASENYTSISVLQANASILTNKYSEGYPNKRYYGGTSVIDQVESLCINRALELFKLDKNEWGVNVQALSGSPANFAVYTALVGKDGKIMGMDLPSGGHLTHGYKTKTKKISATSIFFESASYKVNEKDLLDYDKVKISFDEFKPDLFICGASAYPRDFDYKKLREICDENESFLMADIAHISGFVAVGEMKNPFEFCDVVTMTTHKTLRGPRAALIFFRKKKNVRGNEINIEEKINFAVFPGLQGGPHNQTIAAVAVALKQAMTSEYKSYIINVKENARYMGELLMQKGYKILTGGTDCHLLLIDVSETQLSGAMIEKLCEMVDITINKNALPNSKSALNPKGIRIGSCALTTRGFDKDDFLEVIEIVNSVFQFGCKTHSLIENKNNIDEFLEFCMKSDFINDIKLRVNNLALKYPIPIFALSN
ncbi:hypothetical protein GVAV_000573 [Gurleya vavrai]